MIPGYPATVLAGVRAAERDGLLPPPSAEVLGDIYPFPAPVSMLPVQALRPEPARAGEDAASCQICAEKDELWGDEHWRVRAPSIPSALHVLFAEPRVHADLDDLPAEAAASMGPMLQRVSGALSTGLDGVGRVHVNRWGDGAAHLHWWFIARPAGMLQLRGSLSPLWDDVLPPLPEDVWRADLDRIAAALAAE